MGLGRLLRRVRHRAGTLNGPVGVIAGLPGTGMATITSEHCLRHIVRGLTNGTLHCTRAAVVVDTNVEGNGTFIDMRSSNRNVPRTSHRGIFVPFSHLSSDHAQTSNNCNLKLSVISHVTF